MDREYRELLLQEMRLGDAAEACRPFLLPWLESSQASLLTRLSSPSTADELKYLNAAAVVLEDLKRSLLNEIEAGRAARGEFRRGEGLDS